MRSLGPALAVVLLLGCGQQAPSSSAPAGLPPVLESVATLQLNRQVRANAERLFAFHDEDRSGGLSPTEAADLALSPPELHALDLDGSGEVSLTEFTTPDRLRELTRAFRQIALAYARSLDRDEDGLVSREEFDGATLVPKAGPTQPHPDPAFGAVAFARADGDHDGVLGALEVMALIGVLLANGYHLTPVSGGV